jgi:hypothetical protein
LSNDTRLARKHRRSSTLSLCSFNLAQLLKVVPTPMARAGRPQQGPVLDRPDRNTHSPGEKHKVTYFSVSIMDHVFPTQTQSSRPDADPLLHCKSVCKSRKRQSRSFFKKFSYDPCAVRNYYGRPSACGRPVDMPRTQGKAPRMAGYKSGAEPFVATDQTFT